MSIATDSPVTDRESARTPPGNNTTPHGYVLPLIGAIVLLLLWGGYASIYALGLLTGRVI